MSIFSFDWFVLVYRIIMTGKVAKTCRSEIEAAFGDFMTQCIRVKLGLETEATLLPLLFYDISYENKQEDKLFQLVFFCKYRIASMSYEDRSIAEELMMRRSHVIDVDEYFDLVDYWMDYNK